MSLREADFIENPAHLPDSIKLGWATSYLTPRLKEKLMLYRQGGLPVYFGRTLFEAFLVRGEFEDYRKLFDKFERNEDGSTKNTYFFISFTSGIR